MSQGILARKSQLPCFSHYRELTCKSINGKIEKKELNKIDLSEF